MRILVIDDDEEFLELLEDYLASHDIETLTANSGERGLAIVEKEPLDLVILDVMMPEMDGFEVLKHLAQSHDSLPIIILTAKGDELERILGLELGADDYLVKPCSSRELLARIHAMARRQEKLRGGQKAFRESDQVKLDPGRRLATVRGDLIKLSSIEFDILKILVQNKGTVMPRERIMELSRGKEFFALDRSIDIQISRLRQKLERDQAAPKLIKTVWGVGYIYTGEAD
jgi:two-component system, OmpR family, phosphate regulon response regulator OmpR